MYLNQNPPPYPVQHTSYPVQQGGFQQPLVPQQNLYPVVPSHLGPNQMFSPPPYSAMDNTPKSIKFKQISIQDHHGRFMGVKPSGKVYTIDHCKEWETFTLEYVRKDQVRIKTYHGQYIGVDPITEDVRAVMGTPQASETFVLDKQGRKRSLRSSLGGFIGTESNGKVYAIGHCRDWELFTFNKLGVFKQPESPVVSQPPPIYQTASLAPPAPLLLLPGCKIRFRSYHGRYLGTDKRGNVYGDRAPPSEWEVFTLRLLSDGRYALRAHYARYMGIQNGIVVASAPNPQAWESFIIEPVSGRYALRTFSNTYVGVGLDHQVYTIGHCKEWETFAIEFC